MSKKLYTAEVTATGGRDGAVRSSDGIIDFEVHKPEAMGGKGGATNPEQLFAAAWSSCFLGAMGAVGEKDHVDLKDATVTVKASFNEEDNSFFLSAELEIHVPSLSIDEAQKLANKAHKVCPYSKATKGNIEVSIKAI
ncbi:MULTISPECIES: organic hydroperoxide resistance protein [unclassified Sphingobacterium]|uniref:organic hydroperoxide resistance protein n=1 Tax=unclassified Sphingobacterium TaxID=2609468 RepID=UPI0025F015ED|nr:MULTISPECIES: organic hydroperoxide resistance protein [unclassified Sphingobacterium]